MTQGGLKIRSPGLSVPIMTHIMKDIERACEDRQHRRRGAFTGQCRSVCGPAQSIYYCLVADIGLQEYIRWQGVMSEADGQRYISVDEAWQPAHNRLPLRTCAGMPVHVHVHGRGKGHTHQQPRTGLHGHVHTQIHTLNGRNSAIPIISWKNCPWTNKLNKCNSVRE